MLTWVFPHSIPTRTFGILRVISQIPFCFGNELSGGYLNSICVVYHELVYHNQFDRSTSIGLLLILSSYRAFNLVRTIIALTQ